MDFLYAPVKDKKSKKVQNKAHYCKVDYSIQPVSKEVIWPGVLNEDSMWCYAHEGSYKKQLRDLYKNYGKYKKLAKNLQKHISVNFSEEEQYKKFADICVKASGHVPEQEIDTLYEKMVANSK